MKLAGRLTVAVSAAFAVVLAVATVLMVQDEVVFTDDQIGVHSQLLGHVVATMVVDSWEEGGEREVREVVRDIDRREESIHVRWVALDARPGSPDYAAPLTAEARRSLRSGEIIDRLNPDDEDTLYTYVPVPSAGHTERAVEISEPLAIRNAHVRSMVFHSAAITALGALASFALALWLGRRFVGRPVSALAEQAQHIGAGDLSVSAPEDAPGELGDLAREMNLMAENLRRARARAEQEQAARQRAEEQAQHAERLATVGRLASGVAHEVGTPLQSISIRTEMIDEVGGHLPEIAQSTAAIRKQTERVATIVRSLLRFARKQPPRVGVHDIRDVIASSIDLVVTARRNEAVSVVSRLPDGPTPARVDSDQIEQVLTNLIVNAMDAMPRGGHITVSVDRATDGYVAVHVEDDGPGMDDETRHHLFEPFFTTKEVGRGTGLGLSIAHGIVREHGGWIDVWSEPGRGSRFSLYLPAEDQPQRGRNERPGREQSPANPAR